MTDEHNLLPRINIDLFIFKGKELTTIHKLKHFFI